jgi:hypothetical protein
MLVLQRLLAALVVGAIFGWAMSTRLPLYPAVLSGVAAGVFMAASLFLIERAERREGGRRGERASDEQGA